MPPYRKASVARCSHLVPSGRRDLSFTARVGFSFGADILGRQIGRVDAPPILPAEVPPPLDAGSFPEPPRHARWRSWAALLILAPYPFLLGIVLPWIFQQAWFLRLTGQESAPKGSILPQNVPDLLAMSAENLVIFGIILGLALAFRGVRANELLARWTGTWQPWVFGFGHSLGLRLAVALLVMTVGGILIAVSHFTGQNPEALKELRPNVENLVDPGALRNPTYLLLCTTLVSFVVAGLREELWRAGVFRFLFDLLPDRGQTRRGQIIAVVVAAVIFGLGHWPQGIAGVALTGTLGLGLGAIMLFHRSLWVAVLAHGFFDATSFALLALVERLGILEKLKGM